MTRLPLLLAIGLAVVAGPGQAQTIPGQEWQLLAIDGVEVEPGATFRIEDDGTVQGKAACNGYGGRSSVPLPALALGPIRATRVACPRLSEEQSFLDALARMTLAELSDDLTLILTAPDGTSLEFVADRNTDPPPVCKTCARSD